MILTSVSLLGSVFISLTLSFCDNIPQASTLLYPSLKPYLCFRFLDIRFILLPFQSCLDTPQVYYVFLLEFRQDPVYSSDYSSHPSFRNGLDHQEFTHGH